MVETAAHLADHVIPRLPVRQWVLAVPKRLRYFLERDAALRGAALRLFLRVVACGRTVRAPAPRPDSGRWPSSIASVPPSIPTCISTASWSTAYSRPMGQAVRTFTKPGDVGPETIAEIQA